jgi:hypothetical protein
MLNILEGTFKTTIWYAIRCQKYDRVCIVNTAGVFDNERLIHRNFQKKKVAYRLIST